MYKKTWTTGSMRVSWGHDRQENTWRVQHHCTIVMCFTHFGNIPLQLINAREPKCLLREEDISTKLIAVFPIAQTIHEKSVWHICSHHVGAGAGKRHVSGVKLQSVDGSWMFPVQHSYLHPTLSAPNVDSPVLRACTTGNILTWLLQEETKL